MKPVKTEIKWVVSMSFFRHSLKVFAVDINLRILSSQNCNIF